MRKTPSSRGRLEGAAEQLRALAHADEAVPVGLRCVARVGLVTASSSASGRTRPRLPRCPARAARRWSAPPGGSGRRPGRGRVRGAGDCPRTATTTASPEARWRSASVSSAASPGGGSTAPVGGAVLAENADELVDLAERLACDLLDRLERGSRSLGSCSCSRRAAPAWTRITLIAWPAESWRSRAMRVRSSAAARRRSRSVSRSARSARSSSSVRRARR